VTAAKRFRPASQWSPLNGELDEIFASVIRAMLERHARESRERATRLDLLTAAERRAMAARGLA
jgi:hypothetical protein